MFAGDGFKIKKHGHEGRFAPDAPDARHASRLQPQWITDDDVGDIVAEIVLRGTTTWPATNVNGPLTVINERR